MSMFTCTLGLRLFLRMSPFYTRFLAGLPRGILTKFVFSTIIFHWCSEFESNLVNLLGYSGSSGAMCL